MNFIEVPRCKITLRCNYKCGYCPIVKSNRPEMSGDKWIELLLSLPGDEIILEGGEPTLHKDFIQIVNEVGKHKGIRIYSNCSFRDELIDNIELPTSWYVSFHPGHKDTAEDVARRCRKLILDGHRIINVHTNEGPPTATPEDFNIFADYGLNLKSEINFFNCEEYSDWQKNKMNMGGYCEYPRAYYDPQGLRFICVKKLEDNIMSGVVSHTKFPAKLFCANLSQCNICDIMVEGVRRGCL